MNLMLPKEHLSLEIDQKSAQQRAFGIFVLDFWYAD